MHADPVLNTVVVLVALLLVAAAAAIGLKRIKFPFTVGLVLVGLAIGTLSHQVPSLEMLESFSLSPDLILFVFLPTLIFESAFNLDVRLLSRNLAPVLILAAPGLVLSTVIVAALMTWLTPLTLGPALVFGALISATDPVAVIALFKDVGAPKRLAILVEGESLFNDATAIVLFTILAAVVVNGGFDAGTVGHGFADFVRVFFGGLLVGGVIGWLMVRTIGLARDEPIVEVALSTVVAYAAFIAAEHYLHVSGVMATVGAGVVIGAYGSTRFPAELKAYLHQFWEYAAFVANSLIFLLVGMSIDLQWLAGFAAPIGFAILAILVARAITVFGLVPAVGRLPGAEPITVQYQTIMYWGGLRGAVAMALALSLPEAFPFRDYIVALTIGIVLFTLISGGLSMSSVIKWLGLDQPSMADRMAEAQGRVAAKREAIQRIERLATAGHFSKRIANELTAEYVDELTEAEDAVKRLRKTRDDDGTAMRQVLLTQAVTVEHHTYKDLFRQGQIGEGVFRELELGIDLVRDALKVGDAPENLPVAEPLEVRMTGWWIKLLERVYPTAKPVQKHRLQALAAEYERDSAIVAAAESVSRAIREAAELSGADESTIEECVGIYGARSARAVERIDQVAEHFPEYATAVQERTARRIALDAEAEAVRRLAATGTVPENFLREARSRVEVALKRLAEQPVEAIAPKPEELLTKVPFFQSLSEGDFSKVAAQLIPKTVLAGRNIITQGERGTSLFLIARGVVAVLVGFPDGSSRRVASLHAGEFFGEMALLSDEPRNATVQAVTACQLYELNRRSVDELCDTSPTVRLALTDAYEERQNVDRRSSQAIRSVELEHPGSE